jgi:exocyst complex protein 7
LREMLQNDIRSVFLKRYKAFFDKYSRIQFSKKNMENYLKYSPQKIDTLVSQLFAQV